MFATLVILLPAEYTGGNLVVQHQGSTMRFYGSAVSSAKNAIYYTAFYCDCEHELEPITSGLRLTLVYNLVTVGAGAGGGGGGAAVPDVAGVGAAAAAGGAARSVSVPSSEGKAAITRSPMPWSML